MHRVAVLALDGVIAFDLATPIEVFGRTEVGGRPGYAVEVCAPRRRVRSGGFDVVVEAGLEALERADTIVVPGVADPTAPVPHAVLEALRAAAGRGTRVASICVGAFTLAAAGLLDGRRATTHWAAAEALAAAHPDVDVDPGVLYVDEGAVLTSAGAAAGLDLCLHLVRRDHGAAVAAETARRSVMPLERAGGQAQFIAHATPGARGPAGPAASLEPLLRWLEAHAHEDLDLAAIAAHAATSPRTLSRRFREQTGTTPLRWLHTARLRRAQHLLESTDRTVERIAAEAGFGTATTLRHHFRRTLATTPDRYRQAFLRR